MANSAASAQSDSEAENAPRKIWKEVLLLSLVFTTEAAPGVTFTISGGNGVEHRQQESNWSSLVSPHIGQVFMIFAHLQEDTVGHSKPSL